MPILMDSHTDNKGFLLDNEEISDLVEIRHWWKNRRDMYEPERGRKPRAHSLNLDVRTPAYPPPSSRRARSPRSPRRKKRHKHQKHGSNVGGVKHMIQRAIRRSNSIEFGEVGLARQGSERRRAHKQRHEFLQRKHDGDESDSESTDSQEDLLGKFQSDRKALPKMLLPNDKRDWDKMTVEQQIERLKMSARREAFMAQAKLREAQEKQKLLQSLSASGNMEFVRQALGKMKDGTSDPVFRRLTNCIMAEDSPPGHASSNGRTRRNSDGEVFE